MQRYTMVFITKNALRVSGGSSAHHQELKTVYTASDIYTNDARSHERKKLY
jgi:ribosomal protein S9